MRKTICLLLAVCTLFACMFSSCGGSREEAFLYYIDASPRNLDPQLASTATEISVVTALYEGLFKLAEDGTVVPAAAESYTISPSGLVYTITLKEGLTFNGSAAAGGQGVTAEDFVFALQRVFMPSTHSPYSANLLHIAGGSEVLAGADISALKVRAVSNFVLEITLTQRDDDFLYALTCPGAMPCNEEFFDSTKGAYGLSTGAILGNGNYVLSTWGAESGVTLTLAAKQEGSGLIPRIRLPIANTEQTAFERLQAEEADAAMLLPTESPGSYPVKEFATTTWVILLNPNRQGLQNENVRLALASVANSTAAAFALPAGFTLATGLVPPTLTLNGRQYEGVLPYTATAAGAQFQNGLNESGLTKLPALTVLYPEDSFAAALMGEVNQTWQKELSAFFTLATTPEAEISEAVLNGQYDIALVPLYAVSENLYGTMNGYFIAVGQPGGGNIAGAGAALAALAAAQGSSKASAAKAVEELLVYGGYICPLYYENTLFATAPWVKGLVVSPFGPTLHLGGLYQE